MRFSRIVSLLLGLSLLVLAGSPAGAVPVTAQQANGEITVFAAASLTDAFKEIGSLFQYENPGTSVTFNLRALTRSSRR